MPQDENVNSNGNGASASGVAEAAGSAKVSLPQYVKDNLGKEIYEDWSKRVEKDPEFAKQIPATLPEFAKTFDSVRSQYAEISKKYKEAEEGRKAPNSPAEYAFDKPELPKGMAYDQALEDKVRQVAHENGVTAKALGAIFKAFNDHQINGYKSTSAEREKALGERAAEQQKAIAAVLEDRRKAWGDQYPERFAAMNAVLSKFPKPVLDRMTATGLSAEPAFIDFLDTFARSTRGDRKLGLNGEPGEHVEDDEKPVLKFEATRKRYARAK